MRGTVEQIPRRRFLRAAVAATVTGGSLLAGCTGQTTDTLPGEEFPAVDEWLTETAVGGEDDTYDGVLQDARGEEAVRIDVGADGNDGTYAYDPSAVAVSPGTTIRWVWIDDREGHNVVANPENQIGESDYEFRSGGPVIEEGHEFEQTLESAGVALYKCEGIAQAHWKSAEPKLDAARGRRGDQPFFHLEPHRQLGMKGGVAVTE